jgi:hypothetical protein
MRISMAITTKVYGRRNASRTIPWNFVPLVNYLPTAVSPPSMISFTLRSAACNHGVRAPGQCLRKILLFGRRRSIAMTCRVRRMRT